MVGMTLERIGRAALDMLYPPRCVLCGRSEAFLCASCRDGLPRADGLRCERCWLPLRGRSECATCLKTPLAMSALRSVFRYEEGVQRLVRELKFGGHSCLAEPLAIELEAALREWAPPADAIVPVPLTASHLRRRGFNQTALLARRLGRATGVPVVEALARRGKAVAQFGSTKEERWRNVQGVFEVRPGVVVAGQRLLVIDDVATTGATLDACARALLAAGAVKVRALTVARED